MDLDGEASGGTDAASEPAAAQPLLLSLRRLLSLLLPPRRRLGPKRCWLDLCSMYGNKTLQCKNGLNASAKCSNTDMDPQSKNNVKLVCNVAYDVID
jgi:hypothetical protein